MAGNSHNGNLQVCPYLDESGVFQNYAAFKYQGKCPEGPLLKDDKLMQRYLGLLGLVQSHSAFKASLHLNHSTQILEGPFAPKCSL